jgi:hypothetical protein
MVLNGEKKLLNGIAGVAVLYMALTCPCETYLKCHKGKYLTLLAIMAGFAVL